jgi:hypothetical protein
MHEVEQFLCRYVSEILRLWRGEWGGGVKGVVCGLWGTDPVGVCVCVCVPLKPEKCHLFLPSPMHACPCHDPGNVFGRLSHARAGREFPTR